MLPLEIVTTKNKTRDIDDDEEKEEEKISIDEKKKLDLLVRGREENLMPFELCSMNGRKDEVEGIN